MFCFGDHQIDNNNPGAAVNIPALEAQHRQTFRDANAANIAKQRSVAASSSDFNSKHHEDYAKRCLEMAQDHTSSRPTSTPTSST